MKFISVMSYNQIELNEQKREQKDLQTLEDIKQLLYNAENENSDVKEFIIEGIKPDREYCTIYLGSTENISNRTIEKWYPLLNDVVGAKLLEYCSFQSLSGKGMEWTSLTAYFYRDGTVKVVIGTIDEVVHCKYIDDIYER